MAEQVDMSALQARLNAAVFAHRQGRLEFAEREYRSLLNILPEHDDLRGLLGAVLLQLGNIDEGRHELELVIERSPMHVQAKSNLAVSYANAGQIDYAYGLLSSVVAQSPDDVPALENLASACVRLKKHDEALTHYKRVADLDPGSAEMAQWLSAGCLNAMGRFAEALEITLALLASSTYSEKAKIDLAMIASRSGLFTLALEALGRIDLDQNQRESYVIQQAGYVYATLSDYARAESINRLALRMVPDNAMTHTNLSFALLSQGKLEDGWREFDWRFGPNSTLAPHGIEEPEWDGRPLNGAGVLVHSEQGVGDVFQFMRFFPRMQALGAKVIFASYPDVLALLKTHEDVEVRHDVESVDLTYTHQIPLLSLGKIFCPTEHDIPAEGPYIFAPKSKSLRWREQLSLVGKLKVGLVWAGNPAHTNDQFRSAALADFSPLAAVPGVEFFSLQKGAVEREAQFPPDGMPLTSLSDEIVDFSDTAAIADNLDLLICVDTSVAHLAGAMGRPVWLLLPADADWRWMTDREDTPWYPTMRLFRAAQGEAWSSVLSRVADALTGLIMEKSVVGEIDCALLTLYQAASDSVESCRHVMENLPSCVDFTNVSAARVLVLNALRCGGGGALLEQGRKIHSLWRAYLVSRLEGESKALLDWQRAWHEEPSLLAAFYLVKAYLERDELEAASQHVDEAARAFPDNFVIGYLRAQVDRLRENWGAAEMGYLEVLKVAPRWAPALVNLGVVYERRGQREDALRLYQRSALVNPMHEITWVNLGKALHSTRRYAASVAIMREICKRFPVSQEALYWYGASLYESDQDDEAAEVFESLLERAPDSDKYRVFLAAVELSRERFDRVEALYGACSEDGESGWLTRMARGMFYLRIGFFDEGWRLNEARLEQPKADILELRVQVDKPKWAGESLNGRTLLVYFEQGFGDVIQFVRFLERIEGRVVGVVHDSILDMLRVSLPRVDFVSRADVDAGRVRYDVYVNALSLPFILNLGANVDPIRSPYITLHDNAEVAALAFKDVPDGLRVGIVWAGNPAHMMDKQRSCPLSAFESLLQIQQVQWCSLQKDVASNQAYDLPEGVILHNLAVHSNSFVETALMIDKLDLFICVDTALAHLAGALNKETWLLISKRSDWRWGTRFARPAWYPSMRIFQQKELGDWAGVMLEVQAALTEWIKLKNDPQQTVL